MTMILSGYSEHIQISTYLVLLERLNNYHCYGPRFLVQESRIGHRVFQTDLKIVLVIILPSTLPISVFKRCRRSENGRGNSPSSLSG